MLRNIIKTDASFEQRDQKMSFFWFCVSFIFLTLFLWPYKLVDLQDNYQFILLPLIPICYYLYVIFFKNSVELKLSYADVFFYIFCLIGLLSYSWAINGGLVLSNVFTWLSYALWMPMVRSIFKKPRTRSVSLYFLVGTALLLIQTLVLVLNNLDWMTLFKYQENYISSFLAVGLFFLWAAPIKISYGWIIKLILTGLTLAIIIMSSTRGVLVALLLVSLLNSLLVKKYNWSAYLLLIGLALVFLYSTGIDTQITKSKILTERLKKEESDRSYMIKNSMKLFNENPFKGVGLGNWILEAYKYGTKGSYKMRNPIVNLRVENHDLYSKLLSELGILGMIPFLAIFLWPLGIFVFNKRPNSNLDFALFNIIVFFLVIASLYLCIQFRHTYFSGFLLVVMFALGLLSRNSEIDVFSKRAIAAMLLVFGILCFSWQVYYNKKVITYWNTFYNASLTIEEKIAKLNAINTNGQTSLIGPTPLDLTLGFYNQNVGHYDAAEKHFRKAIKLAPHNDKATLAYARFLLDFRDNLDSSEYWVKRSQIIQDNSFKSAFILAEIALAKKQFDLAKSHLEIYTLVENKLAVKGLASIKDNILYEPQFEKYEDIKKYLDIFSEYVPVLIKKYSLLYDYNYRIGDCNGMMEAIKMKSILSANEAKISENQIRILNRCHRRNGQYLYKNEFWKWRFKMISQY